MQPGVLRIAPLTNPADLVALAAEATADGHHMVARLIDEWASGANRFDRIGERAYVATWDGQVCGVCGLNIDPFAGDDAVGRVRRFYVSAALRRRGIGSAMMRRLVGDATRRFRELHLRTRDPRAAAFYESLGFTPVAAIERCTHRRSLIA
jgi:GNAT superfamily N-acetyltransferase